MSATLKVCASFLLFCSFPILAQTSTASNRVTIAVGSASVGDASSRTVNLAFPQDTKLDSVKVVLNGKDVSAHFHSTSCTVGLCLSAELSGTDGLYEGKNVLYTTGKSQSGSAASARTRFDAAAALKNLSSNVLVPATMRVAGTSANATSAQLPTGSSFLPPTLSFLNFGEPSGPNQTWFKLGTQSQVFTPACTSTSVEYTVVFLDRRTLAPKTGPYDSANCFNSGTDLATALTQAASQSPALNDLVLVETNSGQATDAGGGAGVFSTAAIGGTAYNCSPSDAANPACQNSGNAVNPDIPVQYVAIGVLGAKPGSAYEYYYTAEESAQGIISPAFAYGMLVEDATGNYNFQTVANVEYTVSPGTTASPAAVTVINQPYGPENSNSTTIYTPPAGSSNGFWLLTLRRDMLGYTGPTCNIAGNPTNPTEIDAAGCGIFFPTGNGDATQILSLAQALNNVPRAELAILTTVGTAGWAGPQAMAQSISLHTGTISLALALQKYGIPDKSMLFTGGAGSTYTVIGAPGMGGPLNGHSVLSSSQYSQQGHSGYVHGVFARGSQGLYQPERSEQQQSAVSDTANFRLGEILAQPPVEWPEFVNGPLLSYNGVSADSFAGQTAAYQYLSWYLLNAWYVQGQYVNGVLQEGVSEKPQKYDIHYFFTGSLNTLLDYHTFDPLNASYPTTSCGNGCTWKNPNGDGTKLYFTLNDFNAVKAQLHNELVDLNSVLTYMVNGSTNVKDVVAAGNSNAALTLLQALSTVQSNITQASIAIDPTKPAAVSPWHIVQMIGSDVAPFVSLATDGVVNAGDIALADKAIGFIGDMFKAAGSTGGGLSGAVPSTAKEIPRLNYKLTTTIGDLAGLDLQDGFLAGFDATLDSITSDAGRLDALGNVAVKNQVLFAPNQSTQNQAINLITKAEQKSLYLSLIPAVYQVHLWPMVSAQTYPDMGFTSSGDSGSCHGFYVNATTPFTSTFYTTYAGTTYSEPWHSDGGQSGSINPFRYDYDTAVNQVNAVDYYVLALPFTNGGQSSDTTSTIMVKDLANILFGGGQGSVNFSFDEFIAINGPMNLPISGGSSALLDLGLAGADSRYNEANLDNGAVCSVNQMGGTTPSATGVTTVSGSGPSSTSGSSAGAPSNATTTVLQAPASALLGDSVTLTAKVIWKSGAKIPAGTLQFRDGSNVMGTVALDATGSATYTTNTLNLGQHGIAAYYLPNDGSLPSSSVAQGTVIYADQPDVLLGLSSGSVQVSYGSTSSAVQLNVSSLYGMTGALQFSCVGLPVNMICHFTPPQASITAGGTATTSFTISSSTAAAASMLNGRVAMLSLPGLLLLFCKRRAASKRLGGLILFSLISMVGVGAVIGCGGSGSNKNNPPQGQQETGTKTVSVQVTSGNLTRTVPLTVNIR